MSIDTRPTMLGPPAVWPDAGRRAPDVLEDLPTIAIMGHPIVAATRPEAIALIEALVQRPRPAHVAYVNAHSLNLACDRADYAAALDRADALLNDGSGVALAARLKGRRFPENLNGSDLTPVILEHAATVGWPIFMLGGRPEVAEGAAACLREAMPGLIVAGIQHGYFPAHADDRVCRAIQESGARLLLVAMGNPTQELWIDRNLERTGADLAIGVGAFLDFAAGVVPRAPAALSRLGVEWLYRLSQEPGRLWRRYLLGNPRFVARAIRDRHRA